VKRTAAKARNLGSIGSLSTILGRSGSHAPHWGGFRSGRRATATGQQRSVVPQIVDLHVPGSGIKPHPHPHPEAPKNGL